MQLRPGGAAEKQIVVVDFNNVRGKTGFRETSAAFLALIADWAEKTGTSGRVVCVIDHGLRPNAALFRGGVVTAFAGPNRTADDVIASAAKTLAADGGLDVLVFTSDRELSSRCTAWQGRSKRQGRSIVAGPVAEDAPPALSAGRVQVMASATMLTMLDHLRAGKDAGTEDASAGLGYGLEAVRLSEASLRHFENNRDKRHFKQRRLRKRKQAVVAAQASGSEVDAAAVPTAPAKLPDELSSFHCLLASDEIAVALAPVPFSERTWHRVLSAERLRRALTRNDSAAAAVAVESESGVCVVPFIASWMATMNNEALQSAPDGRRNDSQRHEILRDHRLRHDATQRTQLENFVLADVELRKANAGSVEGIENEVPRSNEGAERRTEVPPAQVEEALGEDAEERPDESRVDDLLRTFVESGGGGADGVDPLIDNFYSWSEGASELTAADVGVVTALNRRDIKDALKRAAVRERRAPDQILRWHAVPAPSGSDNGMSAVQVAPISAEEVYTLFRGSRRKARRFLKKQQNKQQGRKLRPAKGKRHGQTATKLNAPALVTNEQIDDWLSHGGLCEHC